MNFLHSFVQANNLAFSIAILLIAYIFIAIDKIPKVTVALLGASATLLLGLVSQEKLVNGHLNPIYFANFIDFNVIFLLIGMMIIINISAKSGVFQWIANELLKMTKGNPKLIFVMLALFTAVVSAFLDNVTTVILVMPITFAASKALGINPSPFLITEIISSNIGGTATLIGDPPNIIIGSAAGFSFLRFLTELTDIVSLIFIVCVGILLLCFRKKLVTSKRNMVKVKNIDNSETITDKKLMLRSSITLALVILGFVLHDVIHIQSCIVAMAGASFLLIFEKPKKILHNVEWNTIFFFVGLFIIIGGLEASGGISLMAKWLLSVTNGSQKLTAMVILWGSGIISGIIDNIPYTVTMTPMISQIETTMGFEYAHPLWWCLSLGACLGGNMTIIGAAANVIVSENATAEGHPISFMKYLKYGALVTFVSLILCSLYIYFKFLVKI